jgi:predicted lipoprotein with Yx(FWY)xxD motif/polyisoprenoid-binding protein YceI
MKARSIFIPIVLLLIFVTAAGCSIVKEPETASEPIEAIPLEIQTTAPPTEIPDVEEEPTTAPLEEAPEPVEEPTKEPTDEPKIEEAVNSGLGVQIYQIVPGESRVRFELDEDLGGNRNTVIGSTDQVAGELAIDLNDLAAAQIGILQINARTLATDNEFRNRAIKNQILETNENEFITFKPNAINGLPASIGVGELVAFTITGDLSIRDIANEVTFTVEATALTESEISGTASAVVFRDDYDLNIPSVPNVANVEEEVELYIDFTARVKRDGANVTVAQTKNTDSEVTLLLSQDEELGAYITDGSGMTLYTFANDKPGLSSCYEQCAVAWPPLLIEEDETVSVSDGIPGDVGTTEREDGAIQVTYDGWPLYYWFLDEAPGDITGHNVRNVWAAAWPTTKVLLGGNDELGRFLTGVNGMTLYRFNADEPGMSSCYDQCEANWPPLLLAEGEALNGGAGVVGQLGTIERDDGMSQITYAGMPLYYWVNDEEPGDAAGQNVNEAWFVMPSYTVGVNSSEELGDFLAGFDGMTLYQFANDEDAVSSCYGQCADNWPPLLVQSGENPVPGFGVTGELGVIEREDGTLQVAYDGIPLYFWVNDEAPGDTTGHEVNDVWFVIAP